MAVFSFHPVKTIATGEGGMVTTRDERAARTPCGVPQLTASSRTRRAYAGTTGGWYHEQQALGFNYRLTDIHSALGRSQLRRLDELHRAPQRGGHPLPRGARRR